jgi:hypothetical protein
VLIKIAKILSILFHFIFLGPITYIMLSGRYPIGDGHMNIVYPFLLFVFYLLAPLAIIWYFIRSGRVSDFDVTNRSQRHLLNAILLLFIALFCVITFLLPVGEIYKLNITYSLIFSVVFALVTYYWKISYHLGGVGWFVAVLLQVFGIHPSTICIALAIAGLTAWSRILLKKHTLLQTIVGFCLSVALYYLVNTLFFHL